MNPRTKETVKHILLITISLLIEAIGLVFLLLVGVQGINQSQQVLVGVVVGIFDIMLLIASAFFFNYLWKNSSKL